MDNLGKLKEAYFDLERSRQKEQEAKELAQLLVDGISVVLGEEDIYFIFEKLMNLINGFIYADNFMVLRVINDTSASALYYKKMQPSEVLSFPISEYIAKKAKLSRVANIFSLKEEHGISQIFQKAGSHRDYQSAIMTPVHIRETDYLFIFASSKKSFFTKFHSALLTKFITVFSQAIEKGQFLTNVINTNKLAALGEMSGGIAHEINNPLTVLAVNNEVIKKMYKTGDKKYHDKIMKTLDKSEKVIDKIAKIVQGMRIIAQDKQVVTESRFKLEDLVGYTMDLCASKLASSDIDIHVNIQEDIKEQQYDFDMTLLSQVLMNLILNSIDAIKDKSDKWIKLEVLSTEESLVFFITDSGFGIPSNVVNRIFQPFYTTKEVGQGTGLGLSISKSLIEKMDGALYLREDSEHTCFCINLPIESKE